MKNLLLGAVATLGFTLILAQGPTTVVPPLSYSYPLYDNITPSTGIAFTQNTDVQLPPCTYTVPGGTLVNVKDKIRWWATGTNVGSTDVKTMTARWAATLNTGNSGTNVGIETSATASGTSWTMTGYVSKITNSTQRSSVLGTVQNSGNTGATTPATPSSDSTSALLFAITGKSANAAPGNDPVICTELHVWYERAAP